MSLFDKDVLMVIRRLGTPDDPFQPITETKVISNGFITLRETVDDFTGITVSGGNKTWVRERSKSNELAENAFYCDFRNGYLYFNPSNDNTTVTLNYMGTGGVFISSSRVVHSQDANGNITATIDDALKNTENHIINTKINAEQTLEQKKNQYITELQDKADSLSEQTSTSLQKAQQALTDANSTKSLATEILNDSRDILNNANSVLTASNQAVENSKIKYLPYVETYGEIATKYPDAKNGDVVQVFSTGIKYRRQNGIWEPIEKVVQVTGSNMIISDIQPSETSNTLWVDISS